MDLIRLLGFGFLYLNTLYIIKRIHNNQDYYAFGVIGFVLVTLIAFSFLY